MLARTAVAPLALAMFLNAVASFAFLAQSYVRASPIVDLDTRVAITLHDHVVPAATALLRVVTTFGSAAALAAIGAATAVYLVDRGRRFDAGVVVATFAGTQLLTWVLKATFERERPAFENPVMTASGFSFPSGHALTSLAVYGVIAYVLAGGLRSPRARVASLGGVALLVLAIGFSRLYLGVHYLSDVLAGFSAGLAWLLLAITMTRLRAARIVTS